MIDLSHQTALITGASRGIGAAAAHHLAACGANVVLCARDQQGLDREVARIKDNGGNALGVSCDVTSYEALSGTVKRCVDTFGSLDILVNNAGIIEPIARLADSSPGRWSQVIDVNVKGVYYATHAVLPTMLAQGRGSIVNISSGAATHALEGWSHYCASKAAVLSLTQCTHAEYGDAGVRVLGLSPGTVATDMQVAIKASGINPVSELDPSVHRSPESVAKAIAWLCTAESDHWRGQDFSLRSEEGIRIAGQV